MILIEEERKDIMELSVKIRQLRKMTGLTQEQMANKIDVSRQSVSKWESGSSIPDWESMVKISKLFDIPLNDFVSTDNVEAETQKLLKITLEDLVELSVYNRRKQSFLIFGIIFLLISVLAIIIISIVNSSMLSIQYMLYRYIVADEYSFLPADYSFSYLFAIVSGIIGFGLGVLYFIFSKRNIKKVKRMFFRQHAEDSGYRQSQF